MKGVGSTMRQIFLGGRPVSGGASLDSSVDLNVASDDALLIFTFGTERLFLLGDGKSDVDFFRDGFGDVKDDTTLMKTNAKEAIIIFMVMTVIGCTMIWRSFTIVQTSTSTVGGWIDSQIFYLNLLCRLNLNTFTALSLLPRITPVPTEINSFNALPFTYAIYFNNDKSNDQ